MNSKEVKISEVKSNPNNPRIIKDDKFLKLVQSIQDFPEMLKIRPIVVNSDMVVLGGNMRLKACKEAGLKKIPIIIADDLSAEKQSEFIIKDNVGFGEWDWELIANEWDAEQVTEWGLDIPAQDFLSARRQATRARPPRVPPRCAATPPRRSTAYPSCCAWTGSCYSCTRWSTPPGGS